MVSAAEIQNAMAGAWAVLMGRKQGFEKLDLSVDGFWRSFNAILIALPPMLLAWIIAAGTVVEGSGRLSAVLGFAVLDLTDWILPVVALALLAPPLGLGKRFVHYAVASNWASAIFVWLSLPGTILRMAGTQFATLADLYAIGLFVAALVLFWRLTRVSLERDIATTTAIFLCLFCVSIVVLITLQRMMGLDFPT